MRQPCKTGDGWVIVATFNDPQSAYIARGLLESNGIVTSLTNDTISSVYPMTDTWAAMNLLVPRPMETTARRLLNLEQAD
ncbi:MAG: DUF2007 domain-containing protein [Odoribacter sp.]|nr:DUF2007 domain-containing protein [Odoribacter sp.]